MAIQCVKCSHEMTGYEFLGYLVGDLYELWKGKITRGPISDAISQSMVGVANRIQIVCPHCKKYKEWVMATTKITVSQAENVKHEL